jgi:hypothetical protein
LNGGTFSLTGDHTRNFALPLVDYHVVGVCQTTTGTCTNPNKADDTPCGTDSCSDSGDEFGGGSCSASDWSCTDGKLAVSASAGTDTCGGDDANPNITTYACQNNNACVSGSKSGSDSCSSSSGPLGGGSCSAVDWQCADGKLGSTATSGQDVCYGTADAPSVETSTCNGANNACVAGQIAKADVCSDSGTASGGGVCGATNWSCSNGTLASTSTTGTDTCGDAAQAQTTYFVCGTVDGGSVDDTCVVVPDTTAPDLTMPADVLADLDTPAGTQVTLLASAGDICDAVVSFTWYEGTTVLATTAGLTYTFPLGVHNLTVVAKDDAGNASAGFVKVTVRDTCGNGKEDLYRSNPPACGQCTTKCTPCKYKGKRSGKDDDDDDKYEDQCPPSGMKCKTTCKKSETHVKTKAELMAWIANPTSHLKISSPIAFSNEALYIETRCDVNVQSKAKLTGLTNVFIAADEIDFFGDLNATGRVDLRAADDVAIRQKSTFTGIHTLAVEGKDVDEWGDAKYANRYCIGAHCNAKVRQASRNSGGGGSVRVTGASVDLYGDFDKPGTVYGAATGHLEFCQACKTTNAGDVTLIAGGQLDVHGDLIGAGNVVYTAAGAVEHRQAAQIKASGNVSITAGTSLDSHGDIKVAGNVALKAANLIFRQASAILSSGNVKFDIAGFMEAPGKINDNGAVTLKTVSYKLYQTHDFRFNASCSISGTADKNSKPANGCTVL